MGMTRERLAAWRAGLMRALPVLAGTLMILVVVLANGRPSVFPDTDD